MDKPIALIFETLLLIVLFFLHPQLGPWGIVFIGAAFGILSTSRLLAFISGFIAIFAFWSTYAYYLDYKQGFYLAPFISGILSFSMPWLSYFVTGVIGALPCGLISLTTHELKQKLLS